MSSLALYRALVPEHAAVVDATVSTWLELAARRHTASVFGRVYPEAMVWWAAHRIQRSPGSGASSSASAEDVGTLVMQRDGDLTRQYAQPSSASSVGSSADAELRTTRYGELYLELRDSRAGVGPTAVRP